MEDLEWSRAKFKEGVALILEEWPAVRMAIEYGYVSENFEKLEQNGEMVGNTKEEQILEFFTEEVVDSTISLISFN